MKIGLGTVQFGLNYGVSNHDGQTPPDEIRKILTVAVSHRIKFIDTAALYGSSEQALGVALPVPNRFSIVTKTPRFNSDYITSEHADLLTETFVDSLRKLKQSGVYALLIHSADDLLAQNGHLLFEAMLRLREKAMVRKIGVSVYDQDQIDRILERYGVDIIQLPINLLDQRLLSTGRLAAVKRLGIEIHARSVFLQGLLLMDPARLPPYFDRVRELLFRYHRLLNERSISPVQAALQFVESVKDIDVAIIGVNNSEQLEQLCSVPRVQLEVNDFADFAVNDPEIVNPAKWELGGL